MEIIADEIFKALGYLLIAGVVFFIWDKARDKARGGKGKTVLWKGFLFCAGIAFFASLTLGNPSCLEVDDPLRGGCIVYEDDGYEPTTEQRIASFAYFMTLFYIPVAFGAYKGNNEKEVYEKH